MEGRRPTMVRMARGAPQGGMVGRGHRACWLMRGMIRARKRAPLSIHCLFTVGQWGSPGVSLSGRYALPHVRACVTGRACVLSVVEIWGQVGIRGHKPRPPQRAQNGAASGAASRRPWRRPRNSLDLWSDWRTCARDNGPQIPLIYPSNEKARSDTTKARA